MNIFTFTFTFVEEMPLTLRNPKINYVIASDFNTCFMIMVGIVLNTMAVKPARKCQ